MVARACRTAFATASRTKRTAASSAGGTGRDGRGHVESHRQAGRATAGGRVVERCAEPVAVRGRRLDRGHRRPQGRHRGPQRRRGLLEHRGTGSGHAPGGGTEAEREPGDVLHRTVVQVGGETPALGGLGVEGPDEQPLPVVLAGAQSQQQPQHDGQQQCDADADGAERQRGERRTERGRAAEDGVVRVVDLEQQRVAGGHVYRLVGLEERPLPPLVPVLRRGQVGHLGVGAVGLERLQVVLGQCEPLPDQAGFVGPQDGAVRGPELHADCTGRGGHGPHGAVQPVGGGTAVGCGRPRVGHRVEQRRFHDRAGDGGGVVGRVRDGEPLRRALRDERADRRHGRTTEQGREDHAHQHPAPRYRPGRAAAQVASDDEHGVVAVLGVEGSSSGHRVTVTRARAGPGRDGRPVAIPPRASRRGVDVAASALLRRRHEEVVEQPLVLRGLLAVLPATAQTADGGDAHRIDARLGLVQAHGVPSRRR
ncbi:hypothetical protein DEJ36_14085 [Curtobacterium sp. MCPF17_052]|nr:hypothetical protein [Curtobacterium sp. MCPF17_052]WIB11967.1 hypothetical protein DEJ36_14085 [Curtobacterium sp. MCPF17_052]